MSRVSALVAREIAGVAREAHVLARPMLRHVRAVVGTVLMAATGAGFLLATAYSALSRTVGAEGPGSSSASRS
jgi:hypothetical protein